MAGGRKDRGLYDGRNVSGVRIWLEVGETVVINRVITEIKGPNEETRNEQNTVSYECTRILLNNTNSMAIQYG